MYLQVFAIKKTQHFKCYLAMPIAVKVDPHWCRVKQKQGLSKQLGRTHILLRPEHRGSLTAMCRGFEAYMFQDGTKQVFSMVVLHTIEKAGVGMACGRLGQVVLWLVV